MDRRGENEDAVEQRPRDAAARARQHVGRRQSVAGRVNDHRQVHRDQRDHDGRGQPLCHVEPDVHASISPLRKESAVRRLRPAIDAVGLSDKGQCSWQDWCE